MDILAYFEKHLQSRKLLLPGEKVFVACSGGPDSVALIHLLHSLAPKWGFSLGLLHLNHRLRGKESDKDAAFVKKLAVKLGIPCYAAAGPVESRARRKKYSVEEAAREIRYEVLGKLALKHRIKKIASAHNLNDQAETVLMRMMEGTGPRGLMGIREIRVHENVTYVRPLLPFRKEDILAYLKAGKIAFRVDRTNCEQRFKRNRIRGELLPYLEKNFNPRVMEALARIPSIVAEESRLLESLEARAYPDIVCYRRRDRIYFKRPAFMALAGPLQFRLLGRALAAIDPASGIQFDQWEALRAEFHRLTYCRSLRRDIDIELTPSRIKIYKKRSVR